MEAVLILSKLWDGRTSQAESASSRWKKKKVEQNGICIPGVLEKWPDMRGLGEKSEMNNEPNIQKL